AARLSILVLPRFMNLSERDAGRSKPLIGPLPAEVGLAGHPGRDFPAPSGAVDPRRSRPSREQTRNERQLRLCGLGHQPVNPFESFRTGINGRPGTEAVLAIERPDGSAAE